MTNALRSIIAAMLVIGVAVLARRTKKDEPADGDVDLTRRRATGQPFDEPPQGQPEWTPPDRGPDARA